MDTVEFRILGPLEVRRAGSAVALGGHRQRSVLAMLLVETNRVVPTERLVDAVWGGQPPQAAAATLHAMVSRLRRALEPERAPRAAHGLLVTRPPGYCLQATPESIDAPRFQALSRSGAEALAAGDAERAAALLGDALALWRGPALADFVFEEFAASYAARLEELRLAVTEDHIEAALALGNHRAVVADLEALVEAHPYRERFWAQLMIALYRSGRQAEALRCYRRARAVLEDELGLEPTSALRELERAVLLQDPVLDWVPAADPSRPASRPAPDGRSQGPRSTRPPDDSGPGGDAGLDGIPAAAFAPTQTLTFLHFEVPRGRARPRSETQAGCNAAPPADVIEEVVRRYAGAVAETRGRAVVAVFSRARDGLAAALAVARALQGDNRRDGAGARISLHTGEAVIRRGRYRGLVVSRGARLRSLAHPGQILLTRATSELAAGDFPESAHLRDLGPVALGALGKPEHVFQLCHPALQLDFPALPRPQHAHNLPTALTRFVGRERELTDVRALLEAQRLVTLVGAGGVGKTRLAIEVATGIVDRYPDGTWLVDLAPVDDAALVAKIVATALDLAEESRREPADTLVEHLRTRQALLVVDNCEHVLEASAPLVERILRTCPGVRVLATSREALNVGGEVVWRVPSLRVPNPRSQGALRDTVLRSESVRLLLDRATAVRPDLSVADEDLGALATICIRLDGIPLALELVAARTPVLTLPEIADRLGDRFRLLEGGSRTAVPRHRTLRAAIDWSYGLLTVAERTLLNRLSVFTGHFTLAAAEAVCSGGVVEDRVLDLLGGLVAKSLVLVDNRPRVARYRLLETIREYARRRLDEQEGESTDVVSRRHRDWYLAAAEAGEVAIIAGAGAEGTLDALEAEHDNFRAALGWSLRHGVDEVALRLGHALYPLWEQRNHQSEGLRWLRALLEAADDATALASAVARRAGNLAWEVGDAAAATALYERALAAARRGGDRRHLARALVSLGNLRALRGDPASARSLLEEGHALARTAGDVTFVAESLLFLAWVALLESSYARARQLLREHETVAGASWFQRARALLLLGRVERDTGDYAGARRSLEACRSITATEGARLTEATALAALGSVALAEDRRAEARSAYEEALALSREPSRAILVGPLGGLAELAVAEGRHETAQALLARELEQAREGGDVLDVARTLISVGAAAAARADAGTARSAYAEALSLSRRAGMRLFAAGAVEGLAGLDVAEGRAARAARLLAAAAKIREQIGAPLAPAERPAWERAIVAAQDALGLAGFDAASAEGRTLATADVAALALGEALATSRAGRVSGRTPQCASAQEAPEPTGVTG